MLWHEALVDLLSICAPTLQIHLEFYDFLRTFTISLNWWRQNQLPYSARYSPETSISHCTSHAKHPTLFFFSIIFATQFSMYFCFTFFSRNILFHISPSEAKSEKKIEKKYWNVEHACKVRCENHIFSFRCAFATKTRMSRWMTSICSVFDFFAVNGDISCF